jgi:hypothetical protein
MNLLKKTAFVIFLSSCFVCCRMVQDEIERSMENGVEVIHNRLEPQRLKDEFTSLSFERLFSIDTELTEIADMGLTNIETFDVDSEGNIYVIIWRSDQNYVYKFDHTGRFLKSFLRHGQGPGEMEWGGTVFVWSGEEIMAKDPSKKKYLLYDKEGTFIKEVQLPVFIGVDAILGQGRYLVSWQKNERESKLQADYYHDYYGIAGPDFEEIKEIGGMRWPNPEFSPQIKALTYVFEAAATKNSIFVGDAQKGYEIDVYDLEGHLIRKIRKDFKRLKVPDEIKKNYEKPSPIPSVERTRKKTVFPDWLPPFRYLFVDDKDRLYVMTWEKKIDSREYIYDVFNPQGVFICRTSLGNYHVQGPLKREYESPVIARGGHLYTLIVKENGYKELVVYRMIWK